MDEMRTEIRISVRALVEFILREGDLDSRTTGKTDLLAMQAGGRLHRKIQRRMGAGYQAEVPLKTRVSMGEFDCGVEGRADGIFAEDGLVYIDEIKGVYRDLNLIGELLPLPIPLTTYVARHSFATVLKRSGVSTSIISESLGHSSEKITQIYLDSFENSQIDEAMQHLL